MERKGDRADIVRDVSLGISGAAPARFRGFCDRVLGIRIDEVPTEQSIFMRQNYSIVFCAVVLFLLTNGFYLVKNIIMKTIISKMNYRIISPQLIIQINRIHYFKLDCFHLI